MKRIVECVPNFSEGRDPEKIEAIVSAMREVAGVYLLDRESDAHHNRCVITLAGEPEAVAEAAMRGVGKAAELIDLTKHSGAHPRLGAPGRGPVIPVEGAWTVTWGACRSKIAWRSRKKLAAKSGSATKFPSISTKRRRSDLNARTSKIFARD